jgi:acetyl esterase/lipase
MSHAGVDAIRAQLADSGLSRASIAEQRAALDGMAGSAPPPGVSVDKIWLGGRPAERLTPDGAAVDAVVLYLHGGGYCIGSLGTHRDLGGRLAATVGCPVVTLDYRLAPEHPFPAAVDDATGAFHHLLTEGARPDRMAIAGDSAGGGLTLATLIALRTAGSPLPAAAVCLSPWVDLTQSAEAYSRVGSRDPMVSKAGLDLMADAYLAGVDPRTELASPLFSEHLEGLPPIRIEVGENEALIDDSVDLAERLQGAGVDVSLTVWPEMIHVFQAFPGSLLPEADQSIAGIGSFLAGHLRLPGREV